ncbi:unnamed protein product [Prunus armeniaca]
MRLCRKLGRICCTARALGKNLEGFVPMIIAEPSIGGFCATNFSMVLPFGKFHCKVLLCYRLCSFILTVCANNLTGEYSLLDPSTFDLPSLPSSIPVK